MNFSSPIKYSGFCSFSPNGKHFAITKNLELLVRHTLFIITYYSLLFTIILDI